MLTGLSLCHESTMGEFLRENVLSGDPYGMFAKMVLSFSWLAGFGIA